jgi:hypothetical protein
MVWTLEFINWIFSLYFITRNLKKNTCSGALAVCNFNLTKPVNPKLIQAREYQNPARKNKEKEWNLKKKKKDIFPFSIYNGEV